MGLEGADTRNPHARIHDLFNHYNKIYFEEKIVKCSLKWSSKRTTEFSGVCHYSAFGGCDILLSEPILKFRPVSDLKNTLLHEMIHAYLGINDGIKDHDDHGDRFQEMMTMINKASLLDEERPEEGYGITVYHRFKDEGDRCPTHQWRCANCGDMIKRALDGEPSVSDCSTTLDSCTSPQCHWHMHQKSCGGRYDKVSELATQLDKSKQPATEDGGEQFLDGDNMDVSSGQEKTSKTGDDGIIQRSLEQRFSDVEMEGQKKSCEIQVTSREESFQQVEQNNKSLNFRQYFCSDDVKGNQAVQVDCGTKKSSDIDVRNILFHKRVSTAQSEAEDLILSKSSKQDAAGKETSRIHQSPSRRKKRKIMHELTGNQICKEPLVILAWANWMSYESDEEIEEPLINKRTERRKQESRSELSKGKAVMDHNDEQKLVAAGVHHESDFQSESCFDCPPENNMQADNSKLIVIDDDEVGLPGKDSVTEKKNVPIELSDDENTHRGSLDAHNFRKDQTHGNHFVVEKELSNWRDLESEPHRQDGCTGFRRRREPSNKAGGEDSSALGKRAHRTRGASSQSGETMKCPICLHEFAPNAPNSMVNIHVDKCLSKTS